jgi:hypothetical protein
VSPPAYPDRARHQPTHTGQLGPDRRYRRSWTGLGVAGSAALRLPDRVRLPAHRRRRQPLVEDRRHIPFGDQRGRGAFNIEYQRVDLTLHRLGHGLSDAETGARGLSTTPNDTGYADSAPGKFACRSRIWARTTEPGRTTPTSRPCTPSTRRNEFRGCADPSSRVVAVHMCANHGWPSSLASRSMQAKPGPSRFGLTHNRFRPDPTREWRCVPNGIAARGRTGRPSPIRRSDRGPGCRRCAQEAQPAFHRLRPLGRRRSPWPTRIGSPQ